MLTVPDGLIVRKTRVIKGVVYLVSTVCKGRVERCPKCDNRSFWRSGKQIRRVTDIPHNGTPVELEILIPRVQCVQCHTQIGVSLPNDIQPLSRVTVRLKQFIVESFMNGETITDIGQTVGVSFDTVSRICRPLKYRRLPTGVDVSQPGPIAYKGREDVCNR